jgi:hypothetical protein
MVCELHGPAAVFITVCGLVIARIEDGDSRYQLAIPIKLDAGLCSRPWFI